VKGFQRVPIVAFAGLLTAACASERLVGVEGSSETTETTETADVGGDADMAETGDPSSDTDDQRCLAWCLSGNEAECPSPWAGELCFTRCMNLELDANGPCLAEQREVIECEASFPGTRTESGCETLDCSEAYKRHDLCRGWCSHLGGSPGAGGSTTECDWRSHCYGFEFEARCSVGLDPTPCECFVDGVLAATCERPGALQAFTCDDDIHVLTSCCSATFEAVLLP
jgi:hypothetical protein